MSSSACPKCDSNNVYSYLNNRKCGNCNHAWLAKLDQKVEDKEVSKDRALRIVTQKLNPSSFTSKFASLNQPIELSKSKSVTTPTTKPKAKMSFYKKMQEKKEGKEMKDAAAEERKSKKGAVVSDKRINKLSTLMKKESHSEDTQESDSDTNKSTSLIGAKFPKSLGNGIPASLTQFKFDRLSQHQEPKPEPKLEPKPEPVAQREFTFFRQAIRDAGIDKKRLSEKKKRIRKRKQAVQDEDEKDDYEEDEEEDDDLNMTTSRVTHKRARQATDDHSDIVGNTSTTHMTDQDAHPEILPHPNLDLQPKKPHSISENKKISALSSRRTRHNPNGIRRKTTISSVSFSDDEMTDTQKPSKKKKDDVDYSTDEYVYSGDDSDDICSVYDSDDDNDNEEEVFEEERVLTRDNNISVSGPEYTTTTHPLSAKNTPSEQREQRQAQMAAGLSDSDDPFSDQESEHEEMPVVPKFTSTMPKARAISKKENPYLKFFRTESAKIQEGRKVPLPYADVQSIVSERYRNLSEEELIALGKKPTQIKKQNYLYTKSAPRPKKPSRPKHVIEQEKKEKQERKKARELNKTSAKYRTKNAYEGRLIIPKLK